MKGNTTHATGIFGLILIAIAIVIFCSCNAENDKQGEVAEQPVLVQQENISPEYVWGIDISHYQENVPMEEFFTRLKDAECGFCYIQIGKSKENGELKDSREIAFQMAEYAEKYAIPFGFYYLTSAKNAGQCLADLGLFTLSLVESQKMEWSYNVLPPMIDHEVIQGDSHVESKLEQINTMVQSMNLLGYDDILVYTSASRLDALEEALKGTKSHIWLASYKGTQGTGIRPEENPALIPEFLTSNDQVVCWQYASDKSIFGERFNEITPEFISGVGEIDRNLMCEEYYQNFVAKINNYVTVENKIVNLG